MGFHVLIGIDQSMGQPVYGRSHRHGRQRGAIIVGGALVVTANLFIARGKRENRRIAGIAIERLAQPDLGLRLVVRRQSRPNGSLEITRSCVLQKNGLEESQRFPGPANSHIAAGHRLAYIHVVGEGLGCGIQNIHGALDVAVVHCDPSAAHAPIGPYLLNYPPLCDGQITAASQTHESRIQSAVVPGIKQQPGFLNLDIGGRQGLELGIMGLHAIHVLDGVDHVAAGRV